MYNTSTSVFRIGLLRFQLQAATFPLLIPAPYPRRALFNNPCVTIEGSQDNYLDIELAVPQGCIYIQSA